MHTLYSKILFAGIGLLFATSSFGQSWIVADECQVIKHIEEYNTYWDYGIYNGIKVTCDTLGLVKTVVKYKKGKMIGDVEMKEIDSLLTNYLKVMRKNLNLININDSSYYKNGRFNGNIYIFDKNGLLDNVEIYKDGKIIKIEPDLLNENNDTSSLKTKIIPDP